jgi:hypothetical protein
MREMLLICNINKCLADAIPAGLFRPAFSAQSARELPAVPALPMDFSMKSRRDVWRLTASRRLCSRGMMALHPGKVNDAAPMRIKAVNLNDQSLAGSPSTSAIGLSRLRINLDSARGQVRCGSD